MMRRHEGQRRERLQDDADRVDLEGIKTLLIEEYDPVARVAPSNRTMIKENVPVATSLQETAIDPVCGMRVDTPTARLTADYRGEKYYFCAAGCKRAFEKDPSAYLTGGGKESSAGCSCCSSDS